MWFWTQTNLTCQSWSEKTKTKPKKTSNRTNVFFIKLCFQSNNWCQENVDKFRLNLPTNLTAPSCGHAQVSLVLLSSVQLSTAPSCGGICPVCPRGLCLCRYWWMYKVSLQCQTVFCLSPFIDFIESSSTSLVIDHSLH